jgi:hypothetical protein
MMITPVILIPLLTLPPCVKNSFAKKKHIFSSELILNFNYDSVSLPNKILLQKPP